MRKVFADTFYWASILNPDDAYHQRAIAIGDKLQGVMLLTTDDVLVELLSYFSGWGERERIRVAEAVANLMDSDEVEIVVQSRETFSSGLQLYRNRTDKQYSGVDVISMVMMRSRGITEILTHDHHFTQEGFVVLL